jgi:hypothetical protein
MKQTTDQKTELWQVGKTLLTPTTRRWSKDEWYANEARERRCVFRYFTSLDQGRGRELIAEFRNPDDAALAVKAVNELNARPDGWNIEQWQGKVERLREAARALLDLSDPRDPLPGEIEMWRTLEKALAELDTPEKG